MARTGAKRHEGSYPPATQVILVLLAAALIPVVPVMAAPTEPHRAPVTLEEAMPAPVTPPHEPHAPPSPETVPDQAGMRPAPDALDGAPEEEPVPPEPSSYMKLGGRISRVQSGFVFVKTPVGMLTLFSDKGLRRAKPGQRVIVWTHDDSIVVDLFESKQSTPFQRFITGLPAFTSSEQQEIRLWTPEGGQTFPVDAANGTLTSADEGKPITLQVSRSGDIATLPPLHLDIQISNGTRKRRDTVLKLGGKVSRVKAGYAFVETPIGPLTLGKRTGLRNVKAGQELTVWLNDDHLVIDVKTQGELNGTHRFVTSKVVYSSKEKREIRLWTPEGERTISLPQANGKRQALREGTPITVQFNGSGEVIDVRKVR